MISLFGISIIFIFLIFGFMIDLALLKIFIESFGWLWLLVFFLFIYWLFK